MAKPDANQRKLAAEEAAYAAKQGRTTDYSKIIDDVAGNVTEDRAQLVRDAATADAEQVAVQNGRWWPF